MPSNTALGRAAADDVEEAREKVAAMLGCQHSEITFTSGATEASNIAKEMENRGNEHHLYR